MSYKRVKQECPTRVPSKRVLQECQVKVSCKSVLQKCHVGVFYTSVKWERPTKSALEGQVSVPRKIVK